MGPLRLVDSTHSTHIFCDTKNEKCDSKWETNVSKNMGKNTKMDGENNGKPY